MADAARTIMTLLQRGWQTVEGTPVAATRRVPYEPGSIDLQVERDTIRRRLAASLATSHSSSPGLMRAGLAYEQRGYYDELALDLTAFFGAATISGAGADKTWAFAAPDSGDPLKRLTYEVGSVDTMPEEERLIGCVGSSLTLSWNKTDDLMEAIELVALRNTQTAKTGALSQPSGLVPILGRLARVYIDAAGGSYGGTAYNRCLSGEIRIETGLSRRYGSDGNDYPNRVAVIGPRVVGASLLVEYDTAAHREAWRDADIQKVRVEFPGASLGGSAYNARFDLNGTFDAAPVGEDEGVTTLALELVGEYESSLAAEIEATVVCSLTALP